MADNIDDGGPAFPAMKPMHRITQDGDIQRVASENDGMSLRDWFAGQALQGICASGTRTAIQGADDAYRFADAMLAARKKGGG